MTKYLLSLFVVVLSMLGLESCSAGSDSELADRAEEIATKRAELTETINYVHGEFAKGLPAPNLVPSNSFDRNVAEPEQARVAERGNPRYEALNFGAYERAFQSERKLYFRTIPSVSFDVNSTQRHIEAITRNMNYLLWATEASSICFANGKEDGAAIYGILVHYFQGVHEAFEDFNDPRKRGAEATIRVAREMVAATHAMYEIAAEINEVFGELEKLSPIYSQMVFSMQNVTRLLGQPLETLPYYYRDRFSRTDKPDVPTLSMTRYRTAYRPVSELVENAKSFVQEQANADSFCAMQLAPQGPPVSPELKEVQNLIAAKSQELQQTWGAISALIITGPKADANPLNDPISTWYYEGGVETPLDARLWPPRDGDPGPVFQLWERYLSIKAELDQAREREKVLKPS